MTQFSHAMREGHYARKQIFSRSWLIAWSHRRRFATGLALAQGLAGARVLDYGCGDGTFLALLMSGRTPPKSAVGAEIREDIVADCQTRLGATPGLSFAVISELGGPEHRGTYDAVFCMEVLEHVARLDAILDKIVALVKPGGQLLVSVPVEIGPTVLIKQTMRRIAGWQGIGDYPGTSPYSFCELFAAVFAGPGQHIARPVHEGAGGQGFHDHKGFNWKVLRVALASRLTIEAVRTSPVPWLPPWLASQVWISCRRSAGASSR